ncbi:hypothetical protein [Nocardia sp. CA-120079]|uniref:hypothetical protein n=1 Tax=Nocardia sp. CA-120079 TaxID=3239974 RepID=UPI003D97F00F
MDASLDGSMAAGRSDADRVLELIDNALGDPGVGPDADGDTGRGTPPDDSDPDDDGDGEDEPAEPARHCSTGKLTIAQARIVDGWRRQLTVSDRRWSTPNRRPPASSSDCIAAAVIDLLDRAEPDYLKLIRYADRIRGDLALERGHGFPLASVVSFYLPADYADRADALLADARAHHADLLDQAREQVLAELPSRATATARVMRMMSVIAALNIPSKVYKLPVGTLARLAIERWSRRSPATVVAAAVSHGREHHEQLHRARRDMGIGDPRR